MAAARHTSAMHSWYVMQSMACIRGWLILRPLYQGHRRHAMCCLQFEQS